MVGEFQNCLKKKKNLIVTKRNVKGWVGSEEEHTVRGLSTTRTSLEGKGILFERREITFLRLSKQNKGRLQSEHHHEALL